MKNLNKWETLSIIAIWTAAILGIYLTIKEDSFISFICICAAYYLNKWIILRKE